MQSPPNNVDQNASEFASQSMQKYQEYVDNYMISTDSTMIFSKDLSTTDFHPREIIYSWVIT
jgi:hypothetical protein